MKKTKRYVLGIYVNIPQKTFGGNTTIIAVYVLFFASYPKR